MVTPVAKREAVAHLQACHGMSDWRACRVIDADRKSVRYCPTRDDDAPLRERLRTLANQSPILLSTPSHSAASGGRDDQPQ